MKTIYVTAAIIQNKEKEYLIARRKKGSHMANMWEFPGGKIEREESPEECLKRELREEFSIEAVIGEFFKKSEFDYGNKHITLLAYKVESFLGKIVKNCHEEVKWVKAQNMNSFNFAYADIPIVDKIMTLN